MKPLRRFEELVGHFARLDRKTVAMACPGDSHTLYVVDRCLSENLADMILFCTPPQMEGAMERKAAYPANVEVVEACDVDEAAALAVKAVRSGKADVVMKGSLNTDNMLRAVLNKEYGLLPQGAVMSHLTAVEVPDFDRLIFCSDVAVIPYPTEQQFAAMISYDVDVCRKLGIESPNVALLHFSEKTSEKFPVTTAYAAIKRMAAEGAFGEVAVDGPMDIKTAFDREAAEIKGIDSAVAGHTDIVIFPDLEAANTFYKTISFFAHARMAGIVTGTMRPVVIASRSDTALSKFYSLLLACVTA